MFSARAMPLSRSCSIQLCAVLGQVWTALYVLFRLAPAWIRRSIRIRMTSLFQVHCITALRYRFCSRARILTLCPSQASAVQKVRGLSSALPPAAALPLSIVNWRAIVYIYRRSRNPENSPLYCSGISSTPDTLAYSGPFLHHSTIFSTFSLSPSKTASTLPSARFLTQPVMPSSSALSFVLERKNTPWTMPEIKTRTLVFILYK